MQFDELFLRSLAAQGIRNCFGIVGGEAEVLQFDEATGVRFYLTRHEFVAGIMADVCGRISGQPQMCWSTFGPGLTNMATGASSGMLDRSPMLVASAQIPRAQIRYNLSHQCIDNVAFMTPITKASNQLEAWSDLRNIVPESLKLAVDDLPGPVYLSVPLDLLGQQVPDKDAEQLLVSLSPPRRSMPPPPQETDLSAAVQMIAQARYPMIAIGNQVIRDNAQEAVKRYAESMHIPIICSLAAKGAIPEDHPLFLTAANKYLDGVYRRPILAELFSNVDLMILIGYDFGEDMKPVLWGIDKKTIVVNSFNVDMGEIFRPTLLCLGDLHESLGYLQNKGVGKAGLDTKHLALKDFLDKRVPDNIPIGKTDIARVISSISMVLGSGGILCSDVGLHKQYAGLLAKTYRPNRFLCSNVCGSFGFGLPAGMAAKLSCPDEKVVVICGDGGFHSTSQDLETVARYNIPIVIVVITDSAFGLIKYYQHLNHRPSNYNMTHFTPVDFTQLAQANGIISTRVDHVDDLMSTLNTVFETGRPHLIELPVHYDYDLLKHVV